MSGYRVVSSDNHIYEPADLWTSRIDRKYRERCPQIVPFEGGQIWVCDDTLGQIIGQGTNVGKRFDEPENIKLIDDFENVRLGGYLPEEYIKDLDIDGVDYPTVSFILYNHVRDAQLLMATFKVYNDWLSEFCSADPARLGGIAVINLDDVQVGLREIERCRKKGFIGAMITVYPPEGRRYNSPEYEPLWALAQDLDIPLSLHAASNRWGSGENFQDRATGRPAELANMDYGVRMSLADMIYSGVFERYTKLQVGTVEHELSWIPHFLDRLDFNYTQRGPDITGVKFKDDMLPSDFFHRNCFAGFQEDSLGIELRHIIGVDNIPVGRRLPPHRDHVPQEPGDPRRYPGGLHRRGEGEDSRRQRRQGL